MPISRLILAGIVVVSLLPLVLLGPQIHKAIWDNANREVSEKHLLIAQNLTEPLRMFVNTHLDSLKMLANTFQQFDISDSKKLQTLLDLSVSQTNNFNTLALVAVDSKSLALSIKKDIRQINTPDYSQHKCFTNVLESGKREVSAVHRSLVSNLPTIMLGQPVFNLDNQLVAVLLSEISLKPIEKIRARIRFGKRGHSAIFDSKGNVIAHPNADWAAEIKNLSSLPIVKRMMDGKTGVMEFYSPFVKADMIAAYAGVKDIGWGVMVPQPKSEIETEVAGILNTLLAWSILGVIIALIAAGYITHWITRPINQLAEQARRIDEHEARLDLNNIIQSAPREIVQMSKAMQQLIDDLQDSNHEIIKLNDSLHDQISQATADLRAANNNLQHIASSDHLTTIANRRHFENTVSDILAHRPGKNIGIMLVDIDNFKDINDRYSHAAGDYVLTIVAKLLNRATRPGDIIARYGGDEFVAEFESDVKTLQKRAEDLRRTVEAYPFKWKRQPLRVTLSIGITCHKTGTHHSLDQLMTEADSAMYRAKNAGRNKVAMNDSQ